MKTVLFLLYLSTTLIATNARADWQATLEAQFDIAETFDNLQDWRGIDNLHGYDADKAHMPVKLDGSPSMWDMYDEWSYDDPQEDWIRFHGPENVWRGSGKSLHIQLDAGGEEKKIVGPSRFGLYFGSDRPGKADAYASYGLANSGYYDVYVFYMIKMPPNIFPTKNGGTWPNDQYKWWSYHKFFTISTSFTDIDHVDGATEREGTGCRWEYGCGDYLLQWKPCGSACEDEYDSALRQVGLVQVYDRTGEYYTSYQREEGLSSPFNNFVINRALAEGKWFGLEVHVSRGTPGNHDGLVEVWVYDESGKEYFMYRNEALMFLQPGTDFAFNKFFFGGNISYITDVNNQGLDVSYYVDDFIINGSRIGPHYFSVLKQYEAGERTGGEKFNLLPFVPALLLKSNLK